MLRYLYEQFNILYDEKRIVMYITILGTPQDGDAERRNKVLLVMVR